MALTMASCVGILLAGAALAGARSASRQRAARLERRLQQLCGRAR
jgi:hypothetical protein